MLLRTFSKVHGLCGLRVGYALCGSRELPDAVNQVRQPFFCNAAAQAAALAALGHQDAVTQRVERTVMARAELYEGLSGLGLYPAQSQANFCWFSSARGVTRRRSSRGLAERGRARPGGRGARREGALRVTYGTPTENARFLEVLGGLLS